jgi:hypothetical protein
MALIDLERAVLSLCFRAQPCEALLDELGGERRNWLLYRHMVRDRLLGEIRFALPRSRALLGDAALDHAFQLHLDRDPPRTRYFREIVLAFVTSALPIWQIDATLSPACIDMARYEAALWEVSDLDARNHPVLVDFAFDRVPVLSPALRLLTVSHAVHATPPAAGEYASGEHRLCVHRARNAERPRTWTLTRTTYDLLQRWQRGAETVAESVQQLAAERAFRVDAQFVDGLCASLAQFIEVGIVLGSR